jgi:hypothetical protein
MATADMVDNPTRGGQIPVWASATMPSDTSWPR